MGNRESCFVNVTSPNWRRFTFATDRIPKCVTPVCKGVFAFSLFIVGALLACLGRHTISMLIRVFCTAAVGVIAGVIAAGLDVEQASIEFKPFFICSTTLFISSIVYVG